MENTHTSGPSEAGGNFNLIMVADVDSTPSYLDGN